MAEYWYDICNDYSLAKRNTEPYDWKGMELVDDGEVEVFLDEEGEEVYLRSENSCLEGVFIRG